MTAAPVRLLVVEDSAADARLLREILGDAHPGQFDVITVDRLSQALKICATGSFQAVLCDLGLPDSSGMSAPEAIAKQFPALPLVVLTGSSNPTIGRDAIQLGAQDYLVKGKADGETIARALRYAMERKRMEQELRALNLALERRVHERTGELEVANLALRVSVAQLEVAFMSSVEIATTLSEMRDPYTAGHERRVAAIAVAIGAALGLDAHRIEGLRVAGLLHDVGKIIIPAEILSNPARLSEAERLMLREHAQASFQILRNVKFPWPVAEVVLQHHERIDGSGYPRALKGDEILFEARILAVADVVEAMASHRPYRAAPGLEAALAEIVAGRAITYDALVVDACVRLFREDRFKIDAV